MADVSGDGPYLQHSDGGDDGASIERPDEGVGLRASVEGILLLVPVAVDAAFLAGHAVWLVPCVGPIVGYVLMVFVPYVGVLVRPGPPYLVIADDVGAGDDWGFLCAYYALEGGVYALAIHGARVASAKLVSLGAAWHCVLAVAWLAENRTYYPNHPWALRVPVAYLLCALSHVYLCRRLGGEGYVFPPRGLGLWGGSPANVV